MCLIQIQQFGCYSSVFLLMFFDSQARICLLGKVNHARMVDNPRGHCAAIVGFGTCCSEAGSICVSSPPNRELLEPIGRSPYWENCSSSHLCDRIGIFHYALDTK
jgi:hypothetical protein